ncbi:hypothetical protein [Bradyrhizobium tropiciagri]|uniref:hypothetical protein n=1 Tax=Bradyrhizobium tropiciagri TaxID=312253 RepID=UPI00067D931D|nr:hypothetical protein [Bradyrhizobium tropiciagri]
MFLQVTDASAMMATPQPFDTPVPEAWLAPLTRFLTGLNVADAVATAELSRAVALQNQAGGPEMMIIRVRHKEACTVDEDECLTIIAHIENNELVSDAMFFAGDKISYGDHKPQLPGVRSLPIFFYSRHQVVAVVVTAKGLVITGHPAP